MGFLFFQRSKQCGSPRGVRGMVHLPWNLLKYKPLLCRVIWFLVQSYHLVSALSGTQGPSPKVPTGASLLWGYEEKQTTSSYLEHQSFSSSLFVIVERNSPRGIDLRTNRYTRGGRAFGILGSQVRKKSAQHNEMRWSTASAAASQFARETPPFCSTDFYFYHFSRIIRLVPLSYLLCCWCRTFETMACNYRYFQSFLGIMGSDCSAGKYGEGFVLFQSWTFICRQGFVLVTGNRWMVLKQAHAKSATRTLKTKKKNLCGRI